MNDLRDLYQQLIIDHSRHPHNFGVLKPHTHSGQGYNPLCGDRITLYLLVEKGVIRDIKFEGSGCAISKASASIMTTVLKGRTVDEARTLFRDFHQMATTGEVAPDQPGKLKVLSGVHKYPARVKCAMLAWRTLDQALSNDSKEKDVVSTE